MSKTLMILGAGPDQAIAIRQAQRMGLHVIAIDGDEHAIGLNNADIGICADIRNPDLMIQIGKKYNIDGIITHAIENPEVVSCVAAALDLPGLKQSVARRATNKFERIQCFSNKNVPHAKFGCADSIEGAIKETEALGFPCVFKPLDNSGSRGVTLVRGEDEIERSYRESLDNSHENKVLIEKYVEGHELSTEAFIVNGRIFHLAFDDRNYQNKEHFFPFFIEDGGDLPSILPESIILDVQREIEKSIHALGIDFGVAKGDIIIDSSGPKIIEMAARTSGGFFSSVQIPLHNGINILENLIKASMDFNIDENDLIPKYNRPSIERYIFSKPGLVKGVKGNESIQNTTGIHFFSFLSDIKPGALITPAFAGPTKVGVIIGTGATKRSAIENTEAARKILQVEVM